MRPFEFDFRLPEATFREPGVVRFMEFLDEGGIKDPARRRGIVERILSEKLGGVGDLYVRTMGKQLSSIARIRRLLQQRYADVIEHFRAGGAASALPPELQPAAFNRLYNDLTTAIGQVEGPLEFAGKLSKAGLREVFAPSPEAGAGTRELAASLNGLKRKYGAVLEASQRGPELADRIEAVRIALARGQTAEAHVEIERLQTDLHDAAYTVEGPLDPSLRAVETEAAEEGLAPYEQRPLRPLEGLRRPPPDLLDPGGPMAPPERIEIEQRGFLHPGDQAELAEVLGMLDDPKLGPAAGHRFERLVIGAEPHPLPATLGRSGRRPDVGGKEITIEGRPIAGRAGGFGPRKVRQFWLDLTDRGEIDLVVLSLSPEALVELRRIAGRAEVVLGQPVRVRVRVVAP